ncbi:hypothetical protein ma40 [Moumouvirus australiensis]|uniref:Uncharacterized protein n=1 Tax=Moumouvirus australiensis TaxID=2109587 RepID=A0A2P1EKN9_9VIRU|nr:hypothetical protein QKC55_gp863 [Moumouvirus australiensis]AVL94427.1 hypothetical protein ma40 [Moumouvirus australiensis]
MMENINNTKIAMIIIFFYVITSILQGNYHYSILGIYFIVKNIFEYKFNKGIELPSINYTIIGTIFAQFLALILMIISCKKFPENSFTAQILTNNLSIAGYAVGSFWYRYVNHQN